MTYNISSYKTKKCDLKIAGGIDMIPMLKKRFGIKVEIVGGNSDNVKYIASGCSEGFYMNGIFDTKADQMIVTAIGEYGEGSGSCHDKFLDFLKMTTGNLEMVMVWRRS